jgi:hypothetical protein
MCVVLNRHNKQSYVFVKHFGLFTCVTALQHMAVQLGSTCS